MAYSSIVGPALPEKHERYTETNLAEDQPPRDNETEKDMEDIRRQLHAFALKEAQNLRIEDKLGQILEILKKS